MFRRKNDKDKLVSALEGMELGTGNQSLGSPEGVAQPIGRRRKSGFEAATYLHPKFAEPEATGFQIVD